MNQNEVPGPDQLDFLADRVDHIVEHLVDLRSTIRHSIEPDRQNRCLLALELAHTALTEILLNAARP
jgi:hypothetical protein